MRVVVAPQELKGSLTAAEAAGAMAEGFRRVFPDAELDLVPMADGGPGIVEALLAVRGGERHAAMVSGPLGQPVRAIWARLDDGVAVLEMAAAAGLSLLQLGERDAMRATTYGCGELMRAALDAGCSEIIFGVGGSATVDGGTGLALALGYRFLDAASRDLPLGGGSLRDLARIDASAADGRCRSARIVVACDADIPLLGERGAAVFAPQKGASPEQVVELGKALARLAEVAKRDLGIDMVALAAGGAAGGTAAGLAAFAGAELRLGGPLVAEELRFSERLKGADFCLTGEGRLDHQTPMGKAVATVAALAAQAGVPCYAVVGDLESDEIVAQLGLEAVERLAVAHLSWEETQAAAHLHLADATERLARTLTAAC